MAVVVLGSVALGFGALPSPAAADQVVGAFSMEGGFTPTGGSGGLSDATGIDFSPAGGGTGSVDVSNSPITGNFVGLVAVGNTGTIKDFTFNPFGGTILNFFTINTIAFDLTSIGIVLQDPNFLILKGTGIFHVPGFDATPGEWNFSGQTVAGTGTFSWSATNGATPVPEPTTLALLGTALLGSVYLTRRTMKRT
jgi:PEP-CTERM motif-containing protein